MKSLSERIEEGSIPEPNSGCVLWLAGVTSAGYGVIVVDGKQRLAHRVNYEIARGQIPEGKELDHLCRVLNCINPNHLEAVTHRENILRGRGRTAANAAKTSCKRGHPFTAANTYIARSIYGRVCRHCARERAVAAKRRKRG